MKTLVEKWSEERNWQRLNAQGLTPLMAAAKTGSCAALKILATVECGLNRRVGRNLDTPLSTAVTSGRTEAVRLLLEKGADWNLEDARGISPPMRAAFRGDVETLELFLAKDSSTLNHASRLHGNTVLMSAVLNKQPAAVKFLLDRDANVNTANNLGATALSLAVEDDSLEIIEMLAKHANLNQANSKTGNTPLMVAIRTKSFAAVKFLLSRGVDTNVENAKGANALMFAAAHGDVETIKAIANKDNVNWINAKEGGYTALGYATLEGKVDAVKILLDLGAEVRPESSDYPNSYALGIAIIVQNREIIDILSTTIIAKNALAEANLLQVPEIDGDTVGPA